MLLDRNWIVRATLDSTVVGNNDAGDALDNTNTGDDTARRHLSLGIQLKPGHGAQLEEGSALVDEGGDAVPRQHLVALNVLLPRLVGPAALDAGREVLHARHDLAHGPLVLLELVRGGVDGRGDALDGGGLVSWCEVGDGAAGAGHGAAAIVLEAGELAALAEGPL